MRTSPRSSASAQSSSASALVWACGFSTKTCLPAVERLLGELEMRDDRGRDHDRVQLGVGQQLVEVGRRLRLRMARQASASRSGERSQSQRRSASSPKFRARFGPQ